MNKSLKFKKISDLIIAVLCVLLYCFFIIWFYSKEVGVLKTVAYSVLGLLISLFISIIFHELGHLIFGYACGFKFKELYLFGFKLFKGDNNRLKATFNLVDNTFGYTYMLPKNRGFSPSKLLLYSIGGCIFSFVQLAIYFAIFFILSYSSKSNTFIFYAFGVSFLVPLYVFLINFMPYYDGSDGSVVFALLKGENYSKVVSNIFYVDSLLKSGVSIEKIDKKYLSTIIGYDEYSVKTCYLRYLSKVAKDKEIAFKELDFIEDTNKLPNSMKDVIKCELFYRALINDNVEYVKGNKEEIIDILSTGEEPYKYRVHALLRLYEGDKDWAKLLISSGKKSILNYNIKGLKEVELKLLNDIK